MCEGKGSSNLSENCTDCNGTGHHGGDAPTASLVEARRIVLKTVSGFEYSMDKTNWQPEPVFDGLKPSTSYTFYQRKAANGNVPFGETSKPLKVSTSSTTLFYVTYQLNGGINDSRNPTQYHSDQSNITLYNPITASEHYTFANWTYNGIPVTEINASWATDIELVANWDAISYKITYNLNGGTNSVNNPNTYTIDDEIILENPSRGYFEFLGWKDQKGNFISKITKGTTGNIVLTAIWSEFEINNGVLLYYDGEWNNTTIIIPDSVTSIGDRAFSRRSSLTSITIPDSVVAIGRDAFYGCTSLTNVYYKGNIEDWCNISFGGESSNPMYYADHFYMLNKSNEWYEVTEIVVPDSVTKIRVFQFYGFDNITSLKIGNGVTSIGWCAFEGCSSLASVTIGNSVTSIGYNAFDNCSSLASVTIPDSVTSIGDYAFSGCSSLTSVTIGDGVTSIGEYAFSVCTSLTNVYYKGNIEDWCNISFRGESSNPMYHAEHFYMLNESNEWYEVTEIVVPDTVTKIGKYQFAGFDNITSITIPDSVVAIGRDAFSYCTSLTNVYYKGTIEDWCNIYFDDSGSNPMYYAEHFYMLNESNEWYEVTEIVVPDTVTKIGDYQFCGFNNITSIIIPDSITSIGDGAFYACSSLTSINIPNSVTSIGSSAFSACSSLTSINIPNSVTSIGEYAFSNCTSLTSIIIPDSVTKIEDFTFKNCTSLTSVTIPNSVTSIGYRAFYDCTSLTSINIPNSVTSIGDGAFYDCTSLTSIIIPDSVTSIGSYAFKNCTSLTSVMIPNSVTFIGKEAFSHCTSLTNIDFDGTIEEWHSIRFGSDWDPDGLKTITCTDGVITL